MKNVHTEHCCVIHGCKYNEKDCPVITKRQVQSFPCESCEISDSNPLKQSQKIIVPCKTKPWVGVGGPWSRPDPCQNVHNIIQMVDRIWKDGICFPICPMIESHLMQSVIPRDYQTNLDRCIEMLVGCCDAYVYLPNDNSEGVRLEIRSMLRNNIKVFDSLEKLYDWVKTESQWKENLVSKTV